MNLSAPSNAASTISPINNPILPASGKLTSNVPAACESLLQFPAQPLAIVRIEQQTITLSARRRGFHLITGEVLADVFSRNMAGNKLLNGAAAREKGLFVDDDYEVLAGNRIGSFYIGSEDGNGETSGTYIAIEGSAVVLYLRFEGGDKGVRGSGEGLGDFTPWNWNTRSIARF